MGGLVGQAWKRCTSVLSPSLQPNGVAAMQRHLSGA